MEALPPALVVAAHGSKIPAWIRAVDTLVKDVAQTPGVRDVFGIVCAGYLEDGQPTLADAVDAALRSGAPEIIVVPLFLTASTHLSEDVPGLLGLPNVLPHVRRRLVAEGQRVLPHGLPIRLAPLGDVAEVLYRNAVRRCALEVKDKAHEAIVIVGYGSTIHFEQWEALMHDIRLRLLQDGWGGVAHAYCGHVVQLSPEPTEKAILHAAQQAGIRRVHVIPLLLGISELQTGPIAVGCRNAAPRLLRTHVQLRYAADAVLPDGDLAARIGYVGMDALGVTPPVMLGALRRSGNRGPTGLA